MEEITSVIVPNAEVKFYIDASLEKELKEDKFNLIYQRKTINKYLMK